jgi:hypothetical protein
MDCSRTRNPSTVPRKYLHLQLEDSSRSPEFSMLTDKTVADLGAKERTYFILFEALKKDLAGSYKLCREVASIGMGDSSSARSGTFRLELAEIFL